ncbi:MAG: hypothetical protein HC779_07710 [Phyllobacteriaceae bacterium]|nr:hypothetical protein [Phyllobacteriaceae bacterium]
MADSNIMSKAQSRFQDLQKKTDDRNKAKAEYELEAKARNVKTAKLKALRLAKEEADRAAAALLPVVEKPKRASRAKA